MPTVPCDPPPRALPADEQPAPLSGYVRFGHIDLPLLVATEVVTEATARGVPWADVINDVLARWVLARRRPRRRRS